MRRLTLIGVALVATACGVLAEAPDEATGEAASEVTADRTVTLGKCTAIASEAGPPTAAVLPPSSATGSSTFFLSADADRVLTNAELKLTIHGEGKSRRVTKVQATIAQASTKGTAVVAPGTLITAYGVGTDAKPESEGRLLLADSKDTASKVTIGTRKDEVDLLQLVNDLRSKQAWAIFGTAKGKVIATAPSCTFDAKAWAVLKNIGCEKALYVDNKPPSACEPGGADAGAPKPATDAGKPTTDGGAGDAASEAGSDSEPAPKTDDEPTTGDESSLNEPDDSKKEPPVERSASKTPEPQEPVSTQSDGCTASPRPAGSPALLAAFGLLFGVLSRRRRRA